jgi:HEAT repeat protein
MKRPTGVLVASLALASGCTSVPELVSMLKGDDARAQATATSKLGSMGQKAVPPLLILMGEEEPDVRARACIVFGRIGAKGREAIPALVRALGDEAPPVGRSAAWALSRIGPLASEALKGKCKDKDPVVGELAIWALAEIYPQPREAAELFARALRADDVRVRKAAADGLAKLGARARDAVGVLIEVTDDPDVEVRSSAIAALGYVGADAKEAVPALAAALQRETPALKILVLRALRRMGARARVAAGAIAPLLADKSDPALRKEAMLALADIRTVPKGHLGPFLEALKDYDVAVSGASGATGLAGRVMRRIGRQLFTPLVELSHSGEEADRRRAVWAMGYAPTTGAIVAELTEFLEDESAVIRAVAARSLGEHGRAAGSSSFALTRLLGDDDPAVRSAAAAAIRKVGPGR